MRNDTFFFFPPQTHTFFSPSSEVGDRTWFSLLSLSWSPICPSSLAVSETRATDCCPLPSPFRSSRIPWDRKWGHNSFERSFSFFFFPFPLPLTWIVIQHRALFFFPNKRGIVNVGMRIFLLQGRSPQCPCVFSPLEREAPPSPPLRQGIMQVAFVADKEKYSNAPPLSLGRQRPPPVRMNWDWRTSFSIFSNVRPDTYADWAPPSLKHRMADRHSPFLCLKAAATLPDCPRR